MKEHNITYYETFDGKKFYVDGPDGHNKNAFKIAQNHEINLLKEKIGEHKYYIIAIYFDDSKELQGYVGKIKAITKRIEFAQKFKTIEEAYVKYYEENKKIIGIDS